MRKTSTSQGTTEYTMLGDKLVHLNRRSVDMHFWYNDLGKPQVAWYNCDSYYYVYNQQGDVIALVNSRTNQEAVAYAYDAWGKQISCTGAMAATLGVENPFRYRGYIYDEETGWYYLMSRYYRPEWGRFVSADTVLGVIGGVFSHNCYCYCYNGPVSFRDPSGSIPQYNRPEYIAAMEAHGRGILASQARKAIQSYSSANRNSSIVVTVSEFLGNLQSMVDKRTDCRRSETDTGCASFVDDGITNLPRKVGHAGSTSIFWGRPSSQYPGTILEKQTNKANAIIWGEIDNIGGVAGLIPGMILGERSPSDPARVKHTGVYAGDHMVYSFSNENGYASLRPYNPKEWDLFAWHEGVICD